MSNKKVSFPQNSKKNPREPLSTIDFNEHFNEILTRTKPMVMWLVHQSFDDDKPEIRATILDISEAFDNLHSTKILYAN